MKINKAIRHATRITLHGAMILSMVLTLAPVGPTQAAVNPMDPMMGSMMDPMMIDEPVDEPVETAPVDPVIVIDDEPIIEEVVMEDMVDATDDLLVATDEGATVEMEVVGATDGLKTLVVDTDPVDGQPKTVHVSVEDGSVSTQVTLSGLNAGQEYHLYREQYDNHEVVIADVNGETTFQIDASTEGDAWLQETPSTKYILDDATGGDCASIGTWMPSEGGMPAICMLDQDLTETIEIQISNFILDCNGHSITGPGTDGIHSNLNDYVGVKNCSPTGFTYGIRLRNGVGLAAAYNTPHDNTQNILFSNAPGAFAQGNSTSGGLRGIYFYQGCDGGQMLNNTATGAEYGIIARETNGATFTNNQTSNNSKGGFLMTTGAVNMVLTDNTSTNDHIGFYFAGSSANGIVNGSNTRAEGFVSRGVYSSTLATNLLVEDITIDGTREGDNGGYGIQLLAGGTARNNTISNTKLSGIYALYAAATITGNTVTNSGSGAVRVSNQADGTLIQDNTIIDPISQGVQLQTSQGVQVIGNTISGATAPPPSTGIGIYGYTGTVTPTIKGNTITNCYQGINSIAPGTVVGGPMIGDGNVVTDMQNIGIKCSGGEGCFIANNTVGRTVATAIYSYGTSNVDIANNSVGTAPNGIFVDGPVGTVQNVQVRDNLVINAGGTAIYVVNSSAATSIMNNQVQSSNNYGIRLANNTGTMIFGNTVTDTSVGNRTGGIYVVGGSDNQLHANTVYGSKDVGIRWWDSLNGISVGNQVTNTYLGFQILRSDNYYSIGDRVTNDSQHYTYADYGPEGIAIHSTSGAEVNDFYFEDTFEPDAHIASMGIWIYDYFADAANNVINNPTVIGAAYGVYVYEWTENEFNTYGNQVNGGTFVLGQEQWYHEPYGGFDIDWGTTCISLSDGVHDNTFTGITCESPSFAVETWNLFGTNNVIYDNEFTYGEKAYQQVTYISATDPTYSVYPTTTPVLLNDEMGLGNTWLKDDGTGYSQICRDANDDQMCDIPFNTDPGVSDSTDNYANALAGRTDSDGDGWPDSNDNCVDVASEGQHDSDGDGEGDICDASTVIDNSAGTTPLAVSSEEWDLVIDAGVSVDVQNTFDEYGRETHDFYSSGSEGTGFTAFIKKSVDTSRNIVLHGINGSYGTGHAKFNNATGLVWKFVSSHSFIGLVGTDLHDSFAAWADGKTALEARNHFLDNYDGVADGRSDMMVGIGGNSVIATIDKAFYSVSPDWVYEFFSGFGGFAPMNFFAHFSFDGSGNPVTNSSTVLTQAFTDESEKFSIAPIASADPSTGIANWNMTDGTEFTFYSGLPAGVNLFNSDLSALIAQWTIKQTIPNTQMGANPIVYEITDSSYHVESPAYIGGVTVTEIRYNDGELSERYCVVHPGNVVDGLGFGWDPDTGVITAERGNTELRFGSDCDIVDGELVEPTAEPVTIGVGETRTLVTDADLDGVSDDLDNCPDVANSDQADLDWDGLGDACDSETNFVNDGTAPRFGSSDDWYIVIDAGVSVDVESTTDVAGLVTYDFYGSGAEGTGFTVFVNESSDLSRNVVLHSVNNASGNSHAKFNNATVTQWKFVSSHSFIGFNGTDLYGSFATWADGKTALEARNHFLDNYDGVADGRSDLMVGMVGTSVIATSDLADYSVYPDWASNILTGFSGFAQMHFYAHFSIDGSGNPVTNSSTVVTQAFTDEYQKFSLVPLDSTDPSTGVVNWSLGTGENFVFYSGIPAGMSLATFADAADAAANWSVEASMTPRSADGEQPDVYVITDSSYVFELVSYGANDQATIALMRHADSVDSSDYYCVVVPFDAMGNLRFHYDEETGVISAESELEVRYGLDCQIDGVNLPEPQNATADVSAGQTVAPFYDRDFDGVDNDVDNCVNVPNVDQSDLDEDGLGDLCDGNGSTKFGPAKFQFMDYYVVLDSGRGIKFMPNTVTGLQSIQPLGSTGALVLFGEDNAGREYAMYDYCEGCSLSDHESFYVEYDEDGRLVMNGKQNFISTSSSNLLETFNDWAISGEATGSRNFFIDSLDRAVVGFSEGMKIAVGAPTVDASNAPDWANLAFEATEGSERGYAFTGMNPIGNSRSLEFLKDSLITQEFGAGDALFTIAHFEEDGVMKQGIANWMTGDVPHFSLRGGFLALDLVDEDSFFTVDLAARSAGDTTGPIDAYVRGYDASNEHYVFEQVGFGASVPAVATFEKTYGSYELKYCVVSPLSADAPSSMAYEVYGFELYLEAFADLDVRFGDDCVIDSETHELPGSPTHPIQLSNGEIYYGYHDFDHDEVKDDVDNCAGVWNRGQEDIDGDDKGDVCDELMYEAGYTIEGYDEVASPFGNFIVVSDPDNSIAYSLIIDGDKWSYGFNSVGPAYFIFTEDSADAGVKVYAAYTDAGKWMRLNLDNEAGSRTLYGPLTVVVPDDASLDLTAIEPDLASGASIEKLFSQFLDGIDGTINNIVSQAVIRISEQSLYDGYVSTDQQYLKVYGSQQNKCRESSGYFDYPCLENGSEGSAYLVMRAGVSSDGKLVASSATIAMHTPLTMEAELDERGRAILLPPPDSCLSELTYERPISVDASTGSVHIVNWDVDRGRSSDPFEDVPRIFAGFDGEALKTGSDSFVAFDHLWNHFVNLNVKNAVHLPHYHAEGGSSSYAPPQINMIPRVDQEVVAVRAIPSGGLTPHVHFGPGLEYVENEDSGEMDIEFKPGVLCGHVAQGGSQYTVGLHFADQYSYDYGLVKNRQSGTTLQVRANVDCQPYSDGTYPSVSSYVHEYAYGQSATVKSILGSDFDAVPDSEDVCPSHYDPYQGDIDNDLVLPGQFTGGDMCDQYVTTTITSGSTPKLGRFLNCWYVLSPRSSAHLTYDRTTYVRDGAFDDRFGELEVLVTPAPGYANVPDFAMLCDMHQYGLVWQDGAYRSPANQIKWLLLRGNDGLYLKENSFADGTHFAGGPAIYYTSKDLRQPSLDGLQGKNAQEAIRWFADNLDGVSDNVATYMTVIVTEGTGYENGRNGKTLTEVHYTDTVVQHPPSILYQSMPERKYMYPIIRMNPIVSNGVGGYRVANPVRAVATAPRFNDYGVYMSDDSYLGLFLPFNSATYGPSHFGMNIDWGWTSNSEAPTDRLVSNMTNWSLKQPGYQTYGSWDDGDLVLVRNYGLNPTISNMHGYGENNPIPMSPRSSATDRADRMTLYELSSHLYVTLNEDNLNPYACVNTGYDELEGVTFNEDTYCIHPTSDEVAYTIENDNSVTVEEESVGTVEIRYYTDNIVDEETGELPEPEFPTVALVPGEVVTEAVLDDLDGDGFTNDVDDCIGVAGTYQGCPTYTDLTVELHIVDQTRTMCEGGKVSCKMPMGDVETRIVEMPANYTAKNSDLYFEDGIVLGKGASLADGTSTVNHLTGTTYLAVSRWSPDENTYVYTSKEVVGGMADLKYMKQVKKNGEMRYLAASVVVMHGSLLETIFPQYFVWEDTVEYYPVAYVTEDNWEVDVCADAPEGYELTSILDENDQVVSTTECMHTVVPGDPRLFLFEVTDLMSPSPDMSFELTGTHDGKTKKVKLDVPGYRQWKKVEMQAATKAELKAAKEAWKAGKTEVKVASATSKTASVNGTTLTLASNQTLWDAAASQLGSGASTDDVKDLAKAIARANSIAVPEWGISGLTSARSLSAGTSLDLSGLADLLWDLNR